MNYDQMYSFVKESNKIESIRRDPFSRELTATKAFVGLSAIRALDVVKLVSAYEPTAALRLSPGLDVRIGNYHPPSGGPAIGQTLEDLLALIVAERISPFEAHKEYENLHPFTDGNGRSGRAIWLWQMLHEGKTKLLSLGFLHAWYYQSLDPRR